METYTKSLNASERFDAIDLTNSLRTHISKGDFLDKMLFLIKAIVEYVFGMHVGFAIGWLFGLGIGHSYVKHFEPVYFISLNQVAYWRLIPYRFAWNGAIVGSIIGAIAIIIINNRIFNQRVISMYKAGIKNPRDIAEFLGKNITQTKRKIDKLA